MQICQIIMSIAGDQYEDLMDVKLSFDPENGRWIIQREYAEPMWVGVGAAPSKSQMRKF